MATAAMGNTAVGTIKVVTGDVKVIGVDGVARQAHVGDKVHAKETLQTGANAIVQVQLENGRMLDLGRDSKIALDNEILNAGLSPAATTAPTQDIAALQAQIAAGADPSKVAEATAAGGAPGAGGGADGGGGTGVVIDQANSEGEVTSGFNTGPAGIEFPDLDPGVQVVVDTESAPVVGQTRFSVDEDDLDGGTVTGDEGANTLSGSVGNDLLTGGAGADTFVWNSGDTGLDAVTDFTVAQGDVLNVAELVTTDGLVMSAVAADGHLQLQFSSGVTVVQTIDLNNLAVADNAAATALMDQLLANNKIID